MYDKEKIRKLEPGGECNEWGWWEDRTLGEKIGIGIGLGILAVGLIFLFGWVVMLLWNWLMPEIFGLKRVTYWQAWGLLILCCILFKGFGSGSGGGSRSDRKRKRQLRRYMQEEQAEVKAGPIKRAKQGTKGQRPRKTRP